MKLWTTGIIIAVGVLLPMLSSAQEPWVGQVQGYGPPGYSQPAVPGSGLYNELIPNQGAPNFRDSRRLLTVGEAFSRSYARLDYLNWRISGAKNTLLGAPNSSGADLSGQDPGNLLLASDQNGPRAPAPTYAVVPSLTSHYDTLNGLRGVVGIPTKVGTLEAEAFYFSQLENGKKIFPFTSTNTVNVTSPVIAATTLLSDGAVSNNTMILYSESYYAQQRTSLFGSEANWIFPPFTPGQRALVSPIVGFRYLSLQDKMVIGGVDHPDATDPTVTLNHMISSIARNNIFGPQIGLKATTSVARFDFGMETKFFAGINRLSEGVSTQQIYSPTEANRSVSKGRVRFAPVFDLSLSAKYHFTDYFSVYVGYDLLIGSGFSRAYGNIYYDAPTSTSAASQITLKPQLSRFMAQGIAIGGEILFR